VVKLCDIVANISDLEDSEYSKDKKISQVKDKLHYLETVRPAIAFGKSKLPGLGKIEHELNKLLALYGQNKVRL
jgi:hypothetical protein